MGLKTFFLTYVNFKSLFQFSLQHNFGKFSPNIKSNDSFEIRIVLVIRKCPKFLSSVPQMLRNSKLLGGQSIVRHPVVSVCAKFQLSSLFSSFQAN